MAEDFANDLANLLKGPCALPPGVGAQTVLWETTRYQVEVRIIWTSAYGELSSTNVFRVMDTRVRECVAEFETADEATADATRRNGVS